MLNIIYNKKNILLNIKATYNIRKIFVKENTIYKKVYKFN